ncbi:hypothetical protein RB199_08485 [Streptomyces libani]|uniref:Intracellular septation protein A n=2 Tax=Streptomyces nigrescens TaxID=1920 RepID=A0A640TJK7_STRNI|nr:MULTISPECIES: hypothetical protein [Streptomyces]MCW7986138.1 hypothetical protein [Streptomyces platensis subsp. clarensis]WAT97827.1 hypothetical protein STRLI_003816 [Streptomyces libani subsp. libani]WAU05786.1 hypothetical protein STRNI_004212 [Streptomyces nigrescens]GFE23374.1 hypothetical protein Sliba_38270 [Streptomyces libani subsp. libani]GGV92845.1 hypothetical protein GCM10010500_26960 [Streptomyces libani subsp. libani]
MNYLRGFIPWLVFAGVSPAGWQWGALAGLAAAVALLIADRAAGLALDLRLLEYGTIVFFAVLTALAFARPESGLKMYGSALSMGWLALIAWVSIAVRRPFTSGIARRMAPPEVWHTPLFQRINVVLTAAWALSFTLTALAQAAASAYGWNVAFSILIQLAGFVLPARFTAAYPERARARFMGTSGARADIQGGLTS